MRAQLEVATIIAVFQLESSEFVVERLGEGIDMPLLRGRLKMVETLKGPPARFTRYELSVACNDLRMDVGDYFLLATNQHGSLLRLGSADATLMFVATPYSRTRLDTRELRAVRAFLKGRPLPASFGLQAAPHTQKYFLPPPPGADRQSQKGVER